MFPRMLLQVSGVTVPIPLPVRGERRAKQTTAKPARVGTPGSASTDKSVSTLKYPTFVSVSTRFCLKQIKTGRSLRVEPRI